MSYDYTDGSPQGSPKSEQPVRSEPAARPPRGAGETPWYEPVYRAEDTPADIFSPGHHCDGQRVRDAAFPALDTGGESRRTPPGRHGSFLRAVCVVLACVVLSSAVCAAITTAIMNRGSAADPGGTSVVVLGGDQAGATSTPDSTPAGKDDTGGTLTPQEIYALGCSQVVGIRTEVATTNVFGQQTSAAVSGSGFVISSDGYILTNYHVIEYAASGSALTVMFYGNQQSFDADVVAYDADNDLAVVKINAAGLKPVAFGSTLSVGDTVYCIGNPLGELDYTMTSGIVSALDREITTDAGVSVNMFQIDAAVNRGNSGGPIYNSKGQVIGVVTAKYATSGVEGLGFAIPIQDAVNIATDLIQYGYVAGKAYLGISGESVNSTAFQYFNLPYGVYVTEVRENTCAAEAGVKIGDVITALDGTPIESYSGLKNALNGYSAGTSVELTVYRSGEYRTLTGTLGERIPASAGENSGEGSGDTAGRS